MLAYVFWHWRDQSVSASDYETRQRAFHDALAGEPPTGFRESFSHNIAEAPWANGGGDAYEDWYVVDDFAALESLNTGAVTLARSAPHDRAAAHAAGGAGGLYRLRLGEIPSTISVATWFSKPGGTSYPALMSQLDEIVRQGENSLWMRQMVLGPATEFCLLGGRRRLLPDDFSAREVQLRRVAGGPRAEHQLRPADSQPSFSANNELALHVPDPAAAAVFYEQQLGGEIVERTPDCIEVKSGALRLFLLRDPAPTHDRVVPSFDVPDRAAALARLQSAGCSLEPIGAHAPGDVYVRDPFGVLFDVVERNSSRKTP